MYIAPKHLKGVRTFDLTQYRTHSGGMAPRKRG